MVCYNSKSSEMKNIGNDFYILVLASLNTSNETTESIEQSKDIPTVTAIADKIRVINQDISNMESTSKIYL